MQNINDLYYIKDIIFNFSSYYENKPNCDSLAVFKENKKLTKHSINEKAYIFVFKKNGNIYKDPEFKSIIYFEIRFDFSINRIFINYDPTLYLCVKRLKHKLNKKIFPFGDITYNMQSFYDSTNYFNCIFIKKINEFHIKKVFYNPFFI